MGLHGGSNTYAYANGSPLLQLDPYGLRGAVYGPVSEFLKGFGSYYGGLFNGGKYLWRRSGFSGDCEKQRAVEEAAILSAALLAYSTRPDVFAQVNAKAAEWASNNRSYLSGRLTAGGITSFGVSYRLPDWRGKLGIAGSLFIVAGLGDALNAARNGADNPEDFMKAILGDRTFSVPNDLRTKCDCAQ